MEPYKLEDYIRELNDKKISYVPLLVDFLERTDKHYEFVVRRIKHMMEEYADEPDNLCKYIVTDVFNACPKCSSRHTSVKNYNMMWHDGDITCDDCGTYVRMFDAG